jgi:hypothetical protein
VRNRLDDLTSMGLILYFVDALLILVPTLEEVGLRSVRTGRLGRCLVVVQHAVSRWSGTNCVRTFSVTMASLDSDSS